MTHPIVIRTEGDVNSLSFKEGPLEKLLVKPRPVLWKCGEVYLWIPIEKVRVAIRWYNSASRRDIYPLVDVITFVLNDTVPIPKEAGQVIEKYNGHED